MDGLLEDLPRLQTSLTLSVDSGFAGHKEKEKQDLGSERCLTLYNTFDVDKIQKNPRRP